MSVLFIQWPGYSSSAQGRLSSSSVLVIREGERIPKSSQSDSRLYAKHGSFILGINGILLCSFCRHGPKGGPLLSPLDYLI